MELDDRHAVVRIDLLLSIPSTNGADEVIPEAELEAVGENIREEIIQMNLAQIAQASVQGLMEEHFLALKPRVDLVMDQSSDMIMEDSPSRPEKEDD